MFSAAPQAAGRSRMGGARARRVVGTSAIDAVWVAGARVREVPQRSEERRDSAQTGWRAFDHVIGIVGTSGTVPEFGSGKFRVCGLLGDIGWVELGVSDFFKGNGGKLSACKRGKATGSHFGYGDEGEIVQIWKGHISGLMGYIKILRITLNSGVQGYFTLSRRPSNLLTVLAQVPMRSALENQAQLASERERNTRGTQLNAPMRRTVRHCIVGGAAVQMVHTFVVVPPPGFKSRSQASQTRVSASQAKPRHGLLGTGEHMKNESQLRSIQPSPNYAHGRLFAKLGLN
ncbi:hypothetical protein C8J57DRAFT_1237688 [Mycena rebaudengoi]|nr:hypothetical protein C8J57DRAFT_1237688 [Mycena rebaudengoi]